ncbi:MAG: FAD-dependent monooxygenase, partial [Gammaproteobacteria bacterium]
MDGILHLPDRRRRMEKRGGVLVVGAGPVGLITALGLALAGIKVSVIEAEENFID